MPDLLLELLSEEIPARMQREAARDLRRLVTDGLVERGLSYAAAAAFATPRRLTLALTDLPARSPDLREERKGPRADAPEAAVEGFLRSTGLSRDQLEIRADKKGASFFAVTTRPGREAAAIVAEAVEAAVRAFPWPKSMRWGAGSLRWVRPLQSVLAILTTQAGHEIVPVSIDGIAAGDLTRGHRFMSPGALAVASFEDYAGKLRRAHVLLDPVERAHKIGHDADQLAFARGLRVVDDQALLTEIAGLVEWPVVLMGEIEERFLDLPPEVLQTSMKTHQRFLSVRNPATGRIEAYAVVANRETPDHGATILEGNARVLAARLSDATFFWRNDLQTIKEVGMEGMAAKLATVTFHNKLGSQADRVARIAALAREIAPDVGADPDLAERAARLAKADLASAMVYEFPELQGVMGRYYADRAGEDPAVAAAAAEHYAPLGPSDAVPTAPISVAVALADKLDALAAFWAIDEKPTGSRDPFALRRAGLGLIRILLAGGIRLALALMLSRQIGVVGRLMIARESGTRAHGVGIVIRNGVEIDVRADDLLAFLHDRLKVHLRDQGVRHDVIDACLAMPANDDFVLVVSRARALQDFLATEDGANLLTGYKRATNIIEIEERRDGVEYSFDPQPALAETPAERALFEALDAAEAAIAPALEGEDFAAAMIALAALRAPIDAFFDTTTVNAKSPMVRRNRLCLLNRIRAVMNRVAVFSAIEGG